ncbi:alpha-galactosidase [Actinomyces mediterranea]|uniref:alpha-galactosidase n=1 Tax=Actinomyces mediterranea TaxID=1871028 RepID=UPI0009709C99|nr:alpha-galactosidase [Actinomyces mediterranea]
MSNQPGITLLRNGGTSVIARIFKDSLPEILHWGEDLGPLTPRSLEDFALTQVLPITSGTPDLPPRLSLCPQQSEGWIGTPGLQGSVEGRGTFSSFTLTSWTVEGKGTEESPSTLRVQAHDDEADLDMLLTLHLEDSGLLRARLALTNRGNRSYALDSLLLALPTPAEESLVLDQNGHHLREREIATHEFTIGAHERTTRVARGHNSSTIHGTCGRGPLWRSAPVHYVHVAWSGNTRTVAEKTPQGQQCLIAGEILLPGEVVLAPGDVHEGPWIFATWGNGLDEAAARIHQYLRGRPNHPHTPRPVTLNAWEAVYFDHSMERLLPLVEAAAKVGIERFVLDDGWFGSRRDDTSGLGDWVVSEEVWPNGLSPLADAVHERGMQFGLWFEPEMVSPDSDAARAHPDWILSPASHRPQPARHQQVLDLTNPEAFEHVRSQMLAVLDEVRIDYIKWDFNRDLYEAVSPRTGLPVHHTQTLAVYALMDALLEARPGLEIESCAGGGGRIDLGIMERAMRVWASDCIDPLERQQIEAGTALLLPPELVGSHIASTTSHTTGRTLALDMRASTAILSHMGVEWDLTAVSPGELDQLGAWIALHKELRSLTHTGTLVHADHPDPGWSIRGVVAVDKTEAVYFLTRTVTSAQRPTPPVRLPGLDENACYALESLSPAGVPSPVPRRLDTVPWWPGPVTLAGRSLTRAGLRIPDLDPAQCFMLRLRAQ